MVAERAGNLAEPFRRLSVDEAKDLIDRGDVQVVDVRRPTEFAGGRVPGSILIPLDVLLDRSDELSVDQELIFVCAVGMRSAVAAEMAASVGRERVSNMEGGIAAWSQRGYPIEK